MPKQTSTKLPLGLEFVCLYLVVNFKFEVDLPFLLLLFFVCFLFLLQSDPTNFHTNPSLAGLLPLGVGLCHTVSPRCSCISK